MIIDRQTISFGGFPLIEKLVIETPHRYKAWVQNIGCFIHVKQSDSHMVSPDGLAWVNAAECVLLKCGNHFLDIMKQLDKGRVEVVLIHLFPDILKTIFADELPDALTEKRDFEHLNVFSYEDAIGKYVDSLDLYFETPQLVNDHILAAKVKELVLLLVQTGNVASIYELVSELQTGPHVELKRVVRQHLYSDVSTADLAYMCGMSLSTFNRNFKKEFQESPVNYINHQRIERAKELLQQDALSIAEVAYDVGFNDPLYFSRLFKRKMNMSPSQFREELKG